MVLPGAGTKRHLVYLLEVLKDKKGGKEREKKNTLLSITDLRNAELVSMVRRLSII